MHVKTKKCHPISISKEYAKHYLKAKTILYPNTLSLDEEIKKVKAVMLNLWLLAFYRSKRTLYRQDVPMMKVKLFRCANPWRFNGDFTPAGISPKGNLLCERNPRGAGQCGSNSFPLGVANQDFLVRSVMIYSGTFSWMR